MTSFFYLINQTCLRSKKKERNTFSGEKNVLIGSLPTTTN
ncbi:MAG: hypothetical protein MRERV_7c058 [Mycoplasmataceae bacterium RV_VA103A]|nr:MAG: hypothetical protein MRERV_7c058 [Mycoplasmataceae bacterium RV_VA103A]